MREKILKVEIRRSIMGWELDITKVALHGPDGVESFHGISGTTKFSVADPKELLAILEHQLNA